MKTETGGYATSIRTEHGRLLIRVPSETLIYLGAFGESDYLATFARHIEDLRAVALRVAERDQSSVVDVMPSDFEAQLH
ncbi:hypothetical protein QTI33_08305 [Variovorax sp. J22P271]|uniref:hypothetical protein n=1 Tax=Variovorax davisae TaxID=3053515 RepID=UPI002575F4AF|nr:hypothetical protein [Variovorax sp. J22P271]MDM0032136.1 hypothetical protein [Variovorax sp. J22P271]